MTGLHNRCVAFACFAVLALGSLPGCGGKYGGAGRDTVAIEVAGTITLRGSRPYQMLLLQTEEDTSYLLRSTGLLDELEHLNGMRVALTGTTPSHSSLKTPVLTVESYRLLPLAGGEEPLVGTLELVEGRCMLAIDDATRLAIVGDFEHALDAFEGARVWMIGDRPDEGTLNVTGYGIIVPAPSR